MQMGKELVHRKVAEMDGKLNTLRAELERDIEYKLSEALERVHVSNRSELEKQRISIDQKMADAIQVLGLLIS